MGFSKWLKMTHFSHPGKKYNRSCLLSLENNSRHVNEGARTTFGFESLKMFNFDNSKHQQQPGQKTEKCFDFGKKRFFDSYLTTMKHFKMFFYLEIFGVDEYVGALDWLSSIGQRFILRFIFILVEEFKFSLLEREAAKGSVLLDDWFWWCRWKVISQYFDDFSLVPS